MIKEVKKTRRGFLGGCLAILGAIFGAGIIYPVLSYLIPPSKKKSGEIIKVAKGELPPGGMKRFHIRGIPAVVVHSKEGYVAYSLVCSHLGCLVTWEGKKNEFLCPCHGASFDAKGKVLSGPPPTGLEPLTVSEKEREVWIS
jgi:cytochrome b6-f complex iron-sulfur subunit